MTAIQALSSCAVKDDIQVEVRKDWTYKGYESKIMPIKENNTGLLWQVNDSEIFVNGNKGSGAVPNFTYTTTPALTLYNPQFAPFRALQQSLWSPSLPAYTPSAIVTMTDGAGCKKDFPTNTFYILKKDPVVTVSTDKKVICSNGDLCLYLSLKLDVVEATKKYLPTSFIVGYSLRDTRVGIDGTWGYYGTAVAGNDLEFVLTDPNTATYTAIKCVKVPSVVNLSYFTFVVDAGLPNSTAGNGTFSIAHRFAASPTGPIRLEYRAKGTFSTPQTRVVAFNRVYLGSDNLTGNRAYLRTSGNAYTEYSAGTRGDVLMQYDIDIQNTTQYFHAFIDPCLVSAGKIKEEDTEIIQSLKSSTTQDLSGVFNAFPNPFTNDITLNYEVRNEKGSQVSITLYNGLGQLIDKPLDTVFNEQRVFSINYNGSKLTPGIYLFELNIDGNKFLKKVIKKN